MRRGIALVTIISAMMFFAACGGGGDDATLEAPTATATPQVAGATVEASTPTPILVATPTPTGVYTVQAGDTLGAIATRFNVSIDDLVQANDIEDPNVIPVGLELQIPTPTPTGSG
jgi:LysM repeat protein